MAVVICVDGMCGNPEVTFDELREELSNSGHRVYFANVMEIKTHEDRVQSTLRTYSKAVADWPNEKVFLLGFSAGGSAVRIAARRLTNEGKELQGVILLAPAMPRGISYLTKTLAKVMGKRSLHLLFAKSFRPTMSEYTALCEPFDKKIKYEVIGSRLSIAGEEARTLASYFFSPVLEDYRTHTLLLFGLQDQWISTEAQRKLYHKLRDVVSAPTNICVIAGAGHLLLASPVRKEVIQEVSKWIKFRLN